MLLNEINPGTNSRKLFKFIIRGTRRRVLIGLLLEGSSNINIALMERKTNIKINARLVFE